VGASARPTWHARAGAAQGEEPLPKSIPAGITGVDWSKDLFMHLPRLAELRISRFRGSPTWNVRVAGKSEAMRVSLLLDRKL
jgi:hypothetical protein